MAGNSGSFTGTFTQEPPTFTSPAPSRTFTATDAPPFDGGFTSSSSSPNATTSFSTLSFTTESFGTTTARSLSTSTTPSTVPVLTITSTNATSSSEPAQHTGIIIITESGKSIVPTLAIVGLVLGLVLLVGAVAFVIWRKMRVVRGRQLLPDEKERDIPPNGFTAQGKDFNNPPAFSSPGNKSAQGFDVSDGSTSDLSVTNQTSPIHSISGTPFSSSDPFGNSTSSFPPLGSVEWKGGDVSRRMHERRQRNATTNTGTTRHSSSHYRALSTHSGGAPTERSLYGSDLYPPYPESVAAYSDAPPAYAHSVRSRDSRSTSSRPDYGIKLQAGPPIASGAKS